MRRHDSSGHRAATGPAVVATGLVISSWLHAGRTTRAARAERRRATTVSLLREFLDEPMASTRRAAWGFFQAEGDAVQHFSHYYLTDPTYPDPSTRDGIAAVLRVLLFQRTVQELREVGELDEHLYRVLLEPHRRAWSGYTARMAERSASHPDAIARGDAGLFTWRTP